MRCTYAGLHHTCSRFSGSECFGSSIDFEITDALSGEFENAPHHTEEPKAIAT